MRTSAVLATVLTLAACSDELPAAPVEEPPHVVRPVALGGFTAEITPTTISPSGEVIPGRTLWQDTNPRTGGGNSANPARSIQLRSTAPFSDPPDSGPSGSCTGATQTITAPVEIINFYPEKLESVFVTFDWMTPSAHAVCNTEAAPVAVSNALPVTSPAGALGNIRYTIDGGRLAGSSLAPVDPPDPTCTDCVTPGGSQSEPWTFDYSTEGTFTVHGYVYAEAFPQPPAVYTPTLFWGATQDLPLQVWVYDTRANDAGEPWAWQIQLDVCEGTSSGCTGETQTKIITYDEHNTNNRHTNFDITAADLDPIVITPNTSYRFTAWSLWYPDGVQNAATGTQVQGSFPNTFSALMIGTPTVVEDPEGGGFGDGDRLVWSVEDPLAGRDTVAEWDEHGPFEICTAALPAYTATCTRIYSGLVRTYFSATGPDGNGVWTYTWQPDYATWTSGSPTFPRPAQGTVGYWRIRNQYTDGSHRSGYWSQGRKLVFGDKPTGLGSTGTAISFTTTGTNESAAAQVQICDTDTTCTATPAAASGGPTSWTYTYTGGSGTYYWRARPTYAGGAGPWSAIQTGTAP